MSIGLGTRRCVKWLGQTDKQRYKLRYLCRVGKLTLLTIAFVCGVAIAPAASAEPLPQVQGDCHQNYSSPCVPTGYSDVDCAGGSGNGPGYVDGPVYVAPGKSDVYGLDSDGDGVGCES